MISDLVAAARVPYDETRNNAIQALAAIGALATARPEPGLTAGGDPPRPPLSLYRVYSHMKKLLLLAAFAAIGCGPGTINPADILQPDVRVHHLAIRNLGLSGGTLDVVMAFHNPNGVNLKGLGLTAGLDIEGNHFGDIDMTNPFTLAGKDTTLITVPLTFRYANVASAVRSALQLGAVNYAVNGKFTVNTPVNTSFDVPFSGQGNVPLLRP